MPKDISPSFFRQPTLKLARSLLGMKLSTFVGGHTTSGMIVEVEAYEEALDEAAHSFRGRTARNDVMFWDGGHCYVYLIYGVHHCVNVVTGKPGIGNAILIRALEPLEGVGLMHRRRRTAGRLLKSSHFTLTSGPGKVCQALAIDRQMTGEHLLQSKIIRLEKYRSFSKKQIGSSRRIGISKSAELEWRFFLKDNAWITAHPKEKSKLYHDKKLIKRR